MNDRSRREAGRRRKADPGRKADLGDLLRVEPGSPVDLSTLDPDETHGHDRKSGEADLDAALDRMAALHDRLWAEAKRSVLVVLQGRDASGKDGTIRRVAGAFNPMGCEVTSFKVPTAIELAHDYLWRVHQRAPARGLVGLFNRSHYEDVLVVRVHELVPDAVWSKRYEQINAFERTLTESGTTILKFFLHISADEQQERFQARLDDATKRWKFRSGDLDERRLWDAYTAAYEDALSRCSTDWAPWYVIPANHKWFRNLAVATILGDAIEALDPQYPPGEDLPKDFRIE